MTEAAKPQQPAEGSWPVRTLFSNLFWPAAAGNVFWAFCTEIIGQLPEKVSDVWPLWWFVGAEFDIHWDVVSRLLVLLFLAAYLSIAWIRTAVTKTKRLRYWFFDFVHLWTIIFAALSAQFATDFLAVFLFVLFFWGTLGHCSGSFALIETGGKEYAKAYGNRYRYGSVNVIGIVVLVAGWLLDIMLIAMPASVLVVVLVWLFFKGRRIQGRFGEIMAALKILDAG